MGLGSAAEVTVRAPYPQPPVMGGYELLEVIGKGGTSRVHRARHCVTGKVVAIKVLDPTNGDPNAVGRFMREARTTALIRHPNVVEVIDVGEHLDGRPYMVMELIDGEDLSMILERKGVMSWDEAKVYLRQICEGLAAAHEVGVVHRDLKLSNCIVTEHQGQPLVKVVDFGLAKPTGDALKRLTALGSVIGTPEYMSPEQSSGHDEVDHRTDIYAAGIMAYEMVTGTPPYSDTNYMRLLLKHMEQPVPSPSSRNPSLSRGVDALLLRALAKNKEVRIPTMREFADEVDMAHTQAYAKIHYRKAIAGAVVQHKKKATQETPVLTGVKTVVTGSHPAPVTNARTAVTGAKDLGDDVSPTSVRTAVTGSSAAAVTTEPARVVTARSSNPDPLAVPFMPEPVTLRAGMGPDEEADPVQTLVYVEHHRNQSWIIYAVLSAVVLILAALAWTFLR